MGKPWKKHQQQMMDGSLKSLSKVDGGFHTEAYLFVYDCLCVSSDTMYGYIYIYIHIQPAVFTYRICYSDMSRYKYLYVYSIDQLVPS